MELSPQTDQEVLLAELDLHKTEFSTLRDEILQWLDTERQYLNLCLAAIAAGLGFAPLLVEQKAYSLMLLFPIVFHVLLWEMLSSVRAVVRISGYLTTLVIPRVNEILDQLGDGARGLTVLGWEQHANAHLVKPSQLFAASVTPTRHWVPILSIAGLIIGYGVVIHHEQYDPTLIEGLLIILNLVFLVLAALQNVITLRSVMRQNTGPVVVPQRSHAQKVR